MSVAPHMRGRVMALYMMIFLGGTPVGAPALGWISDAFGARWTLIGGGFLTTAGSLIAALTLGRLQGVRLEAEWEGRPRVRLTFTESGVVTDSLG
jgi:MFS family permease